MRHYASYFWLTAIALALSAGATPMAFAQPVQSVAALTDGYSDFYRWQGAVPGKPGIILRSEPLAAALSVAEAGEALRLLYTSTNGIDQKSSVAVSGALFLPKGQAPAGGWPLVNWAHGTTGIADRCAPSTFARSQRDSAYINAWLKAGFAVASTDYQGLGTPGLHPYSNYRAASNSVLDMARAASSGRYPIARSVIIVGHSQGAGAAIAAGGYAPDYAPDLHVKAVIATGVPNLSREAIESGLAWSATDSMVTAAYAMIGYELSHVHPDLKPVDVFTPAGLELNNRVENQCLPALMKEAADRGLDPARTFKPGMLARLWNMDVALRSFPTEQLAMPLFIGIGLSDTAALPDTTLKLVTDMCRQGSKVAVRAYRGQDHNGVVPAATDDAIHFAQDAQRGETRGAFCQP